MLLPIGSDNVPALEGMVKSLAHQLHSSPVSQNDFPATVISLSLVLKSNITYGDKVKSCIAFSPSHEHESTWNTAYTMFCTHRVLNSLNAPYTEYYRYPVLHTRSTAHTEYYIHSILHTPHTVHTKYCIHQVLYTPRTTYTEYYIHRVLYTNFIH